LPLFEQAGLFEVEPRHAPPPEAEAPLGKPV